MSCCACCAHSTEIVKQTSVELYSNDGAYLEALQSVLMSVRRNNRRFNDELHRRAILEARTRQL